MGAIIISFSGVDGCGKTTISKKVVKMLRYAGINAVYKHEYEYMLLRPLLKLLGEKRRKRILKSLEQSVIENRDKNNPQTPSIVKLWPLVVLIDYMFMYFRAKISRSLEVLVLDRCLYDHWVSFKGQGIFSKIMEKLYSLAPRPDIPFLLLVDPEVAYLRKRDTHKFTPDIYREGLAEYLKIAKLKSLSIINSSNSIEDTLEQVFSILSTSKKFRSLLIKKSAENRTVWWVLKKYPSLSFSKMEFIFNERVNRLKKTLKNLKEKFKEINIPWALFKTYYATFGDFYVPTYDVDLIFPENSKSQVISYLKDQDIIYSEDEPNKVNIRDYFPYTVSIHFGACWEGFTYFDYRISNLIKNKRSEVEFHSVKVPVLPAEYNILAILAHILFEIKIIRLSDILEINTLLKENPDINYMFKIAESYFWDAPARYLLNKMLEVYKKLNDIKSPLRLPLRIRLGELLWAYLSVIFAERQKISKFNKHRVKVYLNELVRSFVWYLGSILFRRLPFGDLLTPEEIHLFEETSKSMSKSGRNMRRNSISLIGYIMIFSGSVIATMWIYTMLFYWRNLIYIILCLGIASSVVVGLSILVLYMGVKLLRIELGMPLYKLVEKNHRKRKEFP